MRSCTVIVLPGSSVPSARSMNGFHCGNDSKSVSMRHTVWAGAAMSTSERISRTGGPSGRRRRHRLGGDGDHAARRAPAVALEEVDDGGEDVAVAVLAHEGILVAV